ncbi:hypothetical protein GCM10026987_06710 [Belliella aquatica]|uniref:Uncharacterized protein n=2 Tax=Belliella aquatica TaxID=1323734 RepID=A0ABQ1N421_9BACT|nr:hypothetical protein GCM10010993_33870 [Belliella aquatica]
MLMKKIVLVLFGLLGYASVEAQGLVNSGGTVNSGRSQIRRSNDMDFSVFDRDIKGSPYLFDKMRPGKVFEKSGAASTFPEMDINIADNEVHVRQSGRLTVLDNNQIEKIEFQSEEGDVLVYYPISYLNKIRYFELLHDQDSKGKLFIYHEKYFTSTDSKTEMISVTDEGDRFKYKNDLFWLSDENITRLKPGNSGLKAVFGENWKKAKSVADKNNIALKEPAHWLQILSLMED